MDGSKVQMFMELGGQAIGKFCGAEDESRRKLGAQLLLSEVLEYVVHGLGVVPVVNGVRIEEPDAVDYETTEVPADKVEMLDGLADVAYTMYWNALAFGLPLEEAFELVCDNNLEKFVKLSGWTGGSAEFTGKDKDCGVGVEWPEEVIRVQVLKVGGEFYAVGKDQRGKVRKPRHYQGVNLSELAERIS